MSLTVAIFMAVLSVSVHRITIETPSLRAGNHSMNAMNTPRKLKNILLIVGFH